MKKSEDIYTTLAFLCTYKRKLEEIVLNLTCEEEKATFKDRIIDIEKEIERIKKFL
jgi:hypothetical protein